MQLTYIGYRRRLGKLRRAREAVDNKLETKLAQLTDKAHSEEIGEAISDASNDAHFIDEEIRSLQTRYLIMCANRLFIAVPEYKTQPDWEFLQYNGSWALSKNALAQLRREVRAERRESLEDTLLWPASAIGLLGGIVGIVSAFLR